MYVFKKTAKELTLRRREHRLTALDVVKIKDIQKHIMRLMMMIRFLRLRREWTPDLARRIHIKLKLILNFLNLVL